MVDFVKRKIVERLAKFTKDLKPGDISLSVLRGTGELNNLDLNAELITDILRLPPWIRVKSIFCDQIKIDVPFTDLNKSPIRCMLHTVLVEVSTCDDLEEDRERTAEMDLSKLSSSTSSSSYGLAERIIDGMKVEIGAVIVNFANPVFKAKLEMTDVVIESTTSEWKPDILPRCRYKNEEEGSIIIYKKCTWSSIKVEGTGIDEKGNKKLLDQIRLMASTTEIHVAVKRRMSDCKVLFMRMSVDLGDLSWVLTQEQLKSVSLLVQSLTEAAVKWNQQEREKMVLLRGSRDSLDSIGSGGSTASRDDEVRRAKRSKSPKRDVKEFQRETAIKNRDLQYQMGQTNLPSHEVIQDSIHIKSGSLNLQLCDTNGSLLLQINELVIDIYLDQMATSGRCHWNKANIKLHEATDWSSKLVKTAEKIQFVDLPSINLYKLRERGIVVRCSDFCIKSENKELLPIISCDKKTFSLPNDVDNPAFQCVVSLYYYPLQEGNKFLVPRPNIFLYLSPIHANIHQQLFLWLAEFVHGVVRTVNLNLLLSVRTEGMKFIEEMKSKREKEVVQQLPGLDIQFYIPYSKITLPLEYSYADKRPRALQVETGGIHINNHTLLSLMSDSNFLNAWNRCKSGWLSNTSGHFPSNANDPLPTPQLLIDLIEKELKASQMQSQARSNSSAQLAVPNKYNKSQVERRSAPDISHHKISLHQLNLLTIESWCVHTRCVSLSFVSDMSHEATLYAKEFVSDFPLQLWIFQPKKMAEVLGSNSPTMTSVPQASSLPLIHTLVDVPQEVEIKMERLHFLFLMRLKDSFQGFKNRLMQYLTLDSLLETQDKEAFHLVSNDTDLSGEAGEDLRDKLSNIFKDDTSSECVKPSSEEANSLITAGINVQGVNIVVALPTLGPVLKGAKKGSPSVTDSPLRQQPPKDPTPARDPTPTSAPTPSVSAPVTISSLNTTPDHTHKTQSMPQLHVHHMENLKVSMSPTSVSLCEVTEDFVYVSHSSPLSDTPSKSVSPPPPPLPVIQEPESIEEDPAQPPVFTLTSGAEVDNVKAEKCLSSTDSLDKDLGPCDLSTPAVDESTKQAKEFEASSDVHVVSDEVPIPNTSKDQVTAGDSISNSGSERQSLVPTHSLCINTGKVRVLLTLSEEGIAVRATVDSVHIEELTDSELKALENKRNSSRKKAEVVEDAISPVIKVRFELGKSASKYFPDRGDLLIDGVAFLKVSGLKVVLGIKNIMAVKDFFDDEKEADSPLPIQLRILETQLVIKDQLSLPLVHPRNMTVNVPDIFINRGPRAQGTNLVQADTSDSPVLDKPPVVETVANHVNQTPCSKHAFADLLDSFQSFIDALQAHTLQKGQQMIQHPEKVAQLVQELEKNLTASAPSPFYNDAVSCDFYYNVSSSYPHPTIDGLKAEVEALRLDNKKLQLELVSAHEEETFTRKEKDEITRELVDVKVNLASAHLVIEQQLIKLDRLYTENCLLKDRLGEEN